MPSPPVVEILEEVEFSYRQDRLCAYRIPAGFRVEPGQAICLWGSSGAGKSTLMTLLATLRRPQRGRLRFRFRQRGRPLDITPESWPRSAGPGLWRHIGFGFQRPELIRVLSVERNLSMVAGAPAPEQLFAPEEWRQIARATPAKLSGGQVQRLGLLRAFGAGQDLVFLDEPTNNLDRRNRQAVAELIGRERRARGLVTVSHDEEFIRQLGVDSLYEVREEREGQKIVRRMVPSARPNAESPIPAERDEAARPLREEPSP